MIQLKSHIVDGINCINTKNIEKWDETNPPTDVNNPETVRKWLKDRKMPTKTKSGQPIAYELQRWAGRNYRQFYPGPHRKTGEKLRVGIYGRLDITANGYWKE